MADLHKSIQNRTAIAIGRLSLLRAVMDVLTPFWILPGGTPLVISLASRTLGVRWKILLGTLGNQGKKRKVIQSHMPKYCRPTKFQISMDFQTGYVHLLRPPSPFDVDITGFYFKRFPTQERRLLLPKNKNMHTCLALPTQKVTWWNPRNFPPDGCGPLST